MTKTKTIVLGLGNPLLNDDTIGLHIVDEAKKQLAHHFPDVQFKKNHSGSFDLLHDIEQSQQVIIVDSIETGQFKPGHCHECTIEDFKKITQSYLVNWHSINLPTLIELGKKCNFPMPKEIILYGIEGSSFVTFSETATAPLMSEITTTVTKIKDKLIIWSSDYSCIPEKDGNP